MSELDPTVKNRLDDFAALNRRVSSELERGISEGYLERGRVPTIAEKLRVPAPRVRETMWVYIEQRRIASTTVEAYDEEDAVRQIQEAYGHLLGRGEIPGGWRNSHWADGRGLRRHVIVSEPTATRPNLDHNLPFRLEPGAAPRPLRSDAEQTDTMTKPEQGDAMPESMPEPERSEATPVDPFSVAMEGMTPRIEWQMDPWQLRSTGIPVNEPMRRVQMLPDQD
jgi:hypothetical protein